MRRRITFEVTVSLVVAIICLRLGLTLIETITETAKFNNNRYNAILSISDRIAKGDVRKPLSIDEIEEQMNIALQSNLLDYFQIEQDGKIVRTSDPRANVQTKGFTPGVILNNGEYSVLLFKLTNFDVFLSIRAGKIYSIVTVLKYYWYQILLDLVLLIIFVFLIVQNKLQILTSISRILSQLTPKDLDNINHPSQEIRTIVNFLRSFIDQHFKSEEQRNMFRRNLADGIINELFTTKKKPPYSIQVVLVRFDMNNYTRRALQENTEQFTALLSLYFRKVKELRMRYGGLDYQFIGDEKVLFFKIENPDQFEQKLLHSVAFLRDAFDLAKELSKSIPLTFKASIVPGSLVFYELDGSHYFTGSPLIETARYLSTINDKDRSILSLPTVYNEKIKLLSKSYLSDSVLLKGYETPLNISYFDRFDDTYSFEKDATLYLSDRGLIQISQLMRIQLEQDKPDRFFQIFQQIRSVRAEDVNPAVVAEFEKLMNLSLAKYKTIELDNKILSSVVALCWVFVPVGAETGQIKDQFYSLIRHKDIRVASNALMASQRYEWNEEIIEKMLNSPSNRLRGDALVLLGRRGVDQKFFKSWKELIENTEMNFILSGLWASQEVFKFHTENNPTHLKSNPLVETMIPTIEKLVRHTKSQVAQRAQWALDAIKPH